MKKINLISFVVLVGLCSINLNAQSDTVALNTTTTDYTSTKTELSQIELKEEYAGDWLLGIGLNIVEDNGAKKIDDIFQGKSSHFSSPYMFSAEYLNSNQFSFNGSLVLNKYRAGKVVDGRTVQEGEEPMFITMDLNSKFSFRELLKSYVFEPYVLAGAGYTNIGRYTGLDSSNELIEIPQTGRITINAGFGVNYWISNNWGINLNYIGKYGGKSGKNKDFISNQTIFSFGGFIRIAKKKSVDLK